MNKIWILMMAVMIMVPVAAGIVAASGSGEEHGGHNGGHNGEHGAMEHMEKHHMFGTFQYSDGKVQGMYVNFTVNPRTGEIENYSVDNVTVFTSITYEHSTLGKVRVSGAKFFYIGGWGGMNWSGKNVSFNYGWRMVQAMDTPVGVLRILTRGEDKITYTLAPGINATLRNSTVILGGSVEAFMFVSHAQVNVTGNEIIITTQSSYGQNGRHREQISSVLFLEPMKMNVSESMKMELLKGFEKGIIGGQMYIGPHGSEYINYTSGMQAKLTLMERNHIRMTVSGTGINGSRILVLNIANTTLNYTLGQKLKVMFDGRQVKEYTPDALVNGISGAGYAMAYDNGTLTLMVYIPHFSEHTLDVETDTGGAGSSASNENGGAVQSTNQLLWIGGAIILIIVILVAVWRFKAH